MAACGAYHGVLHVGVGNIGCAVELGNPSLSEELVHLYRVGKGFWTQLCQLVKNLHIRSVLVSVPFSL